MTVVRRISRAFGALAFEGFVYLVSASLASGGTITVQNSTVGSTPNLLAYNSGHFYPGSNTKEWWRYAGVSGARVFLTASILEASDDIPGRGDGVIDLTTFELRKALLRSDPNNSSYINWSYFTNRYNTIAKHGANRLQPNHILTELRKLGVDVDVNIGASTNFFIITDANDWAGKWELWQHYYAQAFYLGRGFDVQRYQMYNEPDHVNAGPVPLAEYLMRLQLCSDAIQCALADVNSIYGKSLVPKVLAPVVTTSSYGTWAQYLVPRRHLNYRNESNVNYLVFHQYDYHQYNSTPSGFGASLASLRNSLANAMSPEPPFPVSISEFNVHTAANFDTMPDTLDYPTKYPRLGAIFVNLMRNGAAEMYNFKFSQTDGDADDVYPVRKNGMHYVDNGSAPYNVGGATKAAEVWRLFNKAFAPGRLRKNYSADSSLNALAIQTAYDPVSERYFVFSANDSSQAVPVTIDVSSWNIPNNNVVLIEEVSGNFSGTISHFTSVSNGLIGTFTQTSNSVWLVTIPSKAQQFSAENSVVLTVNSTNDATVKDGANKSTNFGTQTNLVIRNDPANLANRSAALMKFPLPNNLTNLESAVLTLSGATLTTNATVQAHVWGITNNAWSQSTMTWASAPNLSQTVPAGNLIANQFVNGLGDSAFLQGQIAFGSTNFATQQIDVTSFVRSRAGGEASFLISQDPRWNVAYPSFASGDTQPDGIQIVSSEGGANGPRLLLVFREDESIPKPPTIVSQPANQTVFVGGTATFDAAVTGTAPFSYQWRFNETNILADATNSTFTLANVQESQAGLYSVVVSNAVDVVTSSNALLMVITAPPADSLLPIHEPFSYEQNLPLVGQGNWVLNSGTSGMIQSGNLDVPGLLPATGNLFSWGNASMSMRLPLNTNITSGAVYFSFAMRVNSLGTSFTSDGTLAGFTTGTGTSFGTKVNIRQNGTGGYNLGTSKGGGTTFGNWAANNFSIGETAFVVGRYTFNSATGTDDLSALWLNPPPASFGASAPPPATIPDIGNGGTDLAQIDRFFFRAGGTSSSPTELVADELRVGFTWASVTTPLRPALNVSRGPNSVTLAWPTNAPAFVLEQSGALPSTTWSAVTNSPAIIGTNFSVTLDVAPNANRFFRLRK